MSIFLKISKKSRVKRNRREQKRRRRFLQKNRLWLKSILDEIARNGAKESIEEALKLERDEFLARKRHERVPKEKFRGYRNGYSRRSVNLGCGHIEIKMPRVSDSSEPFASQILPPYMRTSPKLLETFPELYLYGLSSGDFREALKILLGEKAVLSPSSILRLKEYWVQTYFSFHKKRLDSHYAYIFADGVYIPRGKGEKLAILVVIGVDSEGRKRLLAMLPGYRESYESWLEVFRHLRERGVEWVGLIVGDGIPGLWQAAEEVFPEAAQQRDWVHKIRNVKDKFPRRDKRLQKRVHEDLMRIYNAGSREEADKGFLRFAERYSLYPTAVNCLLKDRKELTAYFDFPAEHWRQIKTTNPVESSFAPIKMRLKKAKRIISETSALGLVFQLMLKREARWRRIDYPELVVEVIERGKCGKGLRRKDEGRV